MLRHVDKTCLIKKQNDIKILEMCKMKTEILAELKEEMKEEMKVEMKNLQISNNNTTMTNSNNVTNNIVTNNNVTNNMTIVAYGKENILLSDDDFKRIMRRGMKCVPELVRKIHFDKNVPENHNVYISNLRDSYIQMYDGSIWKLMNRRDALQQLYDDKTDILDSKFGELIQSLDRLTIEKFKRFLDNVKIDYNEDDEPLPNQNVQIVKEELKKILYENKDIVVKTRKLQKLNE
jgi:hypothetical protein